MEIIAFYSFPVLCAQPFLLCHLLKTFLSHSITDCPREQNRRRLCCLGYSITWVSSSISIQNLFSCDTCLEDSKNVNYITVKGKVILHFILRFMNHALKYNLYLLFGGGFWKINCVEGSTKRIGYTCLQFKKDDGYISPIFYLQDRAIFFIFLRWIDCFDII